MLGVIVFIAATHVIAYQLNKIKYVDILVHLHVYIIRYTMEYTLFDYAFQNCDIEL